jgi:hypothetical protein
MALGLPQRRLLAAVLLGLGASVAASPPPAPGTPDAGAMFARMAAAMQSQSPPPALSYDETVVPHGLGLRIMEAGGKAAFHVVFSSDSTVRVFHVEQHDEQNAIVVDNSSSKSYTADQLFLSATWTSMPSGDQPTVLSGVRSKMLADIRNGNGGDYTLSFVGTESVDGSPAYHLHMVAKDAGSHPLTDVFIDEQSYLTRRAIGAFTDNSVTNVTGLINLTFDRAGAFWLVTSGQVDATVHAYFKTVSGSATFSASNISFLPG